MSVDAILVVISDEGFIDHAIIIVVMFAKGIDIAPQVFGAPAECASAFLQTIFAPLVFDIDAEDIRVTTKSIRPASP